MKKLGYSSKERVPLTALNDKEQPNATNDRQRLEKRRKHFRRKHSDQPDVFTCQCVMGTEFNSKRDEHVD